MYPNSASLYEANDCHNPAGTPVGGRFCSKQGVLPGGFNRAEGTPFQRATIVAGRRLGGGIQETFVTTMRVDGTEMDSVYKPEGGEVWENLLGDPVRAGITNRAFMLARRDEATYALDQLLGTNVVPETIWRQISSADPISQTVSPPNQRRGDDRRSPILDTHGNKFAVGQAGSFQVFADAVDDYAWIGRGLTVDELYRIGVLDYVTGQVDRHDGNLMRHADGSPVAIDNSFTFAAASPGVPSKKDLLRDTSRTRNTRRAHSWVGATTLPKDPTGMRGQGRSVALAQLVLRRGAVPSDGLKRRILRGLRDQSAWDGFFATYGSFMTASERSALNVRRLRATTALASNSFVGDMALANNSW